MEKDKIIEALSPWNFWNKDIDTGIYRQKYLEKMQSYLKTGQIIALTGIRRSGKSTLMKQFIKSQIESGIDRKSFLYINVEEPKFAGLLSLHFLQEVYDAYVEIIQPSGIPFILLDEIQHVPEWERFARALHEKKEAHVIVSGSTSKLLSPKFGTLLTGRWIDIMVFPLDFQEFLEFKNITIKNKLEILSQKTTIKQLLREYLEFGGLPLVVLSEKKEELLLGYFDDIIGKDIIEGHNIRNPEKVRALAKFYMTNFSSIVSYRSISKFIGLSLDSIERISSYMKDALLLFIIKKYSYSLKEQEVNPRKIYCIDHGLINIMGFRLSENIGKLYENIVLVALHQRKKEVYYYKNKNECDFIIKDGQKISQIIQVCYHLSDSAKMREINGLIEASEFTHCKNAIIITEEVEKEEKVGDITVTYIPLWKWLLEEKSN